MFVLVILGFAAVTHSVPVTPSKKVTEDATKMPKLQLAFLVEDVEYQPSQIQKLQRIIARSGKKFAGRSRILREEDNEIEDFYGRKRRSPQTQQNQVLPITNIQTQDDQLAVESVSTSRVPAAALANILKIAGAGKTPIVRSGGYGGRKRRSPQDSSSVAQLNPIASDLAPEDQIAVESQSTSRVPASALANILKVAGAGKTPISRGGGYSGRKRRSPQDTSSAAQIIPVASGSDDQLALESESASRVPAAALANILKIAGAGKTPISRGGGYSGRKRRSPMDSSSADFDSLETSENLQSLSPSDKRRKRSPQNAPVHANAHQYGLVDNPEVDIAPHGKYGDLQKILALSGAKSQPISRGVSYGRRKRSPQDLSNEIITNEIQTGSGLVKDVAVEAVKIKSHGNYGNIAQFYDTAGADSKNVVVNGRYGRRKREDFIPFNVNEERKVKTLKIEQNDFLALPSRLQIETKDSSDRQVRKRHFTATQ